MFGCNQIYIRGTGRGLFHFDIRAREKEREGLYICFIQIFYVRYTNDLVLLTCASSETKISGLRLISLSRTRIADVDKKTA